MKITKIQKQILKRIKANLIYGDIELIATNTNFSREYVSRVLSTTTSQYSNKVTQAAVTLITDRELKDIELLQKI